jgi:hypothetical protein
MHKKRVLLLLSIAALLLTIFLVIFLILLYSLTIIEMAYDGLTGPFIFIVLLISVGFTIIFTLNRLLKKRAQPPTK